MRNDDYFLTDRKQPATVRVDDIAMMMKQPNQQNNLMAMYGGVITPLAVVHQQIRQPHHQQIGPLVQLRPVGRSNSGSGSRSCDRSPMHDPRFHLLRPLNSRPLHHLRTVRRPVEWPAAISATVPTKVFPESVLP